MPAERSDEVLLLNYLLGNLSEEEQVQVEDRAFADAEYLGALEAAEADLIDSYVRGELAPSDRRRFENRFLTSAGRRSKVEFARALAHVAAEFKPSHSHIGQRPPFWQALLNQMRGFHPAVSFAAGLASLVVIAGAAWLAVHNSSMQSQLSALEAQRTELENRERTLRRQLSQQRPGVPATEKPGPGIERPAPLASLVFLPGLSRAETRVQELSLTPGAQLVHIVMQLEARDEFPRFRAELRTRGGEDVLVRSGLRSRRADGGFSVSFDIPASELTTGEYELALKGLSDGQSADVGYYYFRVQKPPSGPQPRN